MEMESLILKYDDDDDDGDEDGSDDDGEDDGESDDEQHLVDVSLHKGRPELQEPSLMKA